MQQFNRARQTWNQISFWLMNSNPPEINNMLEKSSMQLRRNRDKTSMIAKQMSTISSTNRSHWCSYRLKKSLTITINICRNISSFSRLQDAVLEPKIQTVGGMVRQVHFHQTSSLILEIVVSTTSESRKIRRRWKILTKWVDIRS